MSTKFIHKVSRLFQPANVIPKVVTSANITQKGYNLMIDNGIIKQVNPGMYALLPLGQNALQKLITLVDSEMCKIGAQKIQLPVLTSSSLWKQSNRLEMASGELFEVRDRHDKSYILSPTYEEVITKLVADTNVTRSKLPLLLYQISNKWRDEKHHKLGLLRGREFVMKDLYSFDIDTRNAEMSYTLVSEAYDNILRKIGIDYVRAIGDPGMMGGSTSHEYHYFTHIGEDKVRFCKNCNFAVNVIVSSDTECPQCKINLTEENVVEIGHTFLLDTKYSEIFKATCNVKNENIPLKMGCYGLGLTRILASAIEILSTEKNIRWPLALAPFQVCIIGPKKGSKEERVSGYVESIYDMLSQLKIDTIVDDRNEHTIGRRLLDANRTGYPFVIVVGRQATETTPLFEVHDLYSSICEKLNVDALNDYFDKKCLDSITREKMVC